VSRRQDSSHVSCVLSVHAAGHVRSRIVSRLATLYDLSEQNADNDVVTRASLRPNLHSC